jgi:uncharacterized protein YlxW (UPF0749 family)
MRRPAPQPAPAARRELSTSLLDELSTITVDPAYVEVAARRAQTGTPAARSGASWVFAVAVAALGVLVVVAARDTRQQAPAAATTRSRLVQQIESLVDRTDAESREVDRLRQEWRAELSRTRHVTGDGAAADERLRALELEVGVAAVRGPGLVVRLTDAPAADGSAGRADPDGRIQDRDIQDVVNALWAAGAEAVAVNQQRVGPLTAIRQAGDAVLVDYRPVASPYDVTAVGNADALERNFASSEVASGFRGWVERYGLGFTVSRSSRLDLPAVSTLRVRAATPDSPSPATTWPGS